MVRDKTNVGFEVVDMSDKKDDITQIGTSAVGKDILKFLKEEMFWFDNQMSALKFAVCVAINFNVSIDENVTLTTSHHVQSLDEDSMLKNILNNLFPGDAPYRKAQYLADAGLKFIYEKIKEEEWTLDKFVD